MALSRWLSIILVGVGMILYRPVIGPAAELRFHYVAIDEAGNTRLAPIAGAGGGVGERVEFLGSVREPINAPPRPTHRVTFKHPYTGRTITIPLSLPEDTPRMRLSRSRVIYDYGSYTVEARFQPDGSVDVVYNSGLLRRI
jgi:hypothetical protein